MNSGAYTHVPSEGPLDARIILVGESPWTSEVASGRPFAGASGHLLKRWWGQIGGEIEMAVPFANGIDVMPIVLGEVRPNDPTYLTRSNMRIMNLFPYRPPRRDIGSVPTDKLIEAIQGIHERVARLRDPYVIVTTGNYATFALTGKGNVRADVRKAFTQFKVTEAEKAAGITALRGSIYPYRDLNGRIIKVIPVIHPAGVLQRAEWEKRSIIDWERVKREAGFKEIRDPGREHIVYPKNWQIEEFCHEVEMVADVGKMAVDVETWGNQLTCVGFALTPYKSITIPTYGDWEERMLPIVRWLCEHRIAKTLCNGSYDWYWLDAKDVQLVNYLRDIQSMYHALDPAENHSLNFLASILCPHYVYWKDEAKEAEEIVKYAKTLDALFVYNGLDCCYTRELDDILEAMLRAEGMWDFYFQHYAMMFEPLLRTMRHGIRVDVEKQKAYAKTLRREMKELHQGLNKLAGFELFATEEKTAMREPTPSEWEQLLGFAEYAQWEPKIDVGEIPKAKYINKEQRLILHHRGLTYMMSGKNAGKIRFKKTRTKKDFSKERLSEFFHGKEHLNLPKQYKLRKNTKSGTKKRTESLDEDSIRKLMVKYVRAIEPGKLLLQFREKKKELDYVKGSWDRDGRMRCSYKQNTKAGRLSSSKNPMRRGYNLQNLKR